MGATKNEVPRHRKARDHPPRRAIPSAHPPNPRQAEHPAPHLCSLVRPLSRWRPEALEDKPSAPSRVWNRLPEDVRKQIIDMALEESELSPREMATKFTDDKQYFVSEATVYRLLKAQDLIASPAYIVIKARDEFHTKTARPNEM